MNKLALEKEVGLMNNCLNGGAKLYENITTYINCSRNLIDYVTDAKRIGTILNLILKQGDVQGAQQPIKTKRIVSHWKFLLAHFN